jgi:hypothetical protein
VSDLDVSADVLAQRHFVGALMWQHASVTVTVSGLIAADWLTDVQVRGVYMAACLIAADGIDPEPALIVPAMLRLGLPAHKHGIATALVIDLYTEVPLPGNWHYYGATVAAEHVRDQVHTLGLALAESAHRDPLERLHALIDATRDEMNTAMDAALRLANRGEAA